ncbi:redox-regulated molecular chaperone Hsp33 [Klebsiella pneumoniae]|nr:redox-regulated molecular chaperone Hsp33 [Klebsiella pneumoniae]
MLAELLVATSLLTATLKFAGDITVQLQGDGPLQLAVINGNNQQQLRGVARVQGEIADDADLKTMVGNGYLVITISPEEGERYQGVVGLEGDTLAACLEDYFQRSEQLPTRLIIRTGDHEGQPMAGGMLLQVMPAQDAQTATSSTWRRLPRPLRRKSCSPCRQMMCCGVCTMKKKSRSTTAERGVQVHLLPRTLRGALKTLPDEEIDSILADEGEIDMHCDYCGNHYIFNAMDIAEIRNNASPADPQVH